MSNLGTLDDQYFEWLYSFIGSVKNRNPRRSHWDLARQLYTTPFTWFVPNDDNRVADGLELRETWMAAAALEEVDSLWLEEPCSMLEMLIALAHLASYETNGAPGVWFWHIMHNIELDRITDHVYSAQEHQFVKETLERIIQRTYAQNGTGGLFPLSSAHQNQRQVEIWYQLAAYLLGGNDVPRQ